MIADVCRSYEVVRKNSCWEVSTTVNCVLENTVAGVGVESHSILDLEMNWEYEMEY